MAEHPAEFPQHLRRPQCQDSGTPGPDSRYFLRAAQIPDPYLIAFSYVLLEFPLLGTLNSKCPCLAAGCQLPVADIKTILCAFRIKFEMLHPRLMRDCRKDEIDQASPRR